jgi:hypothetical protein
LGDENISKDEFFRDIISSDKDGFVPFSNILKCNKVKKLGVSSAKQLADACKDSTEVEVSKDGLKVRRFGNKALPEKTGTNKKRETKAEEKKVEKEAAAEDYKVERDDQGRIVFCKEDFENTLIVHFKTEDQNPAEDENYKVNWKDLETIIKNKFDLIKVVYSRADKYEGDLAISRYRLNKAQYAELSTLKDQLIGNKRFSFKETEGEELNEFWQKQGGHFQYCIAPKLRLARKNQRKVMETKREEKAKRQKQSFTIAGVYYMDINKVKSKSRAILNLKKDGEKLEPADEEFMKEILKFHEKHDQKMADFSHFEVGVHPEFAKTRCFFVVNKDGKKEDFSVSKCIMNLELKSNENE